MLLPLQGGPSIEPKCPIALPPFLETKDYRTYIGRYHTDVTLPSEYFAPTLSARTACQRMTWISPICSRHLSIIPITFLWGAGRKFGNRLSGFSRGETGSWNGLRSRDCKCRASYSSVIRTLGYCTDLLFQGSGDAVIREKDTQACRLRIQQFLKCEPFPQFKALQIPFRCRGVE